jgi:hypothetical protein
MFDELHPKQLGATAADDAKRENRFTSANALTIASEFEAAFGRRKLELLIQTQNPDADHQPSRLHKLLLELPWVDVFTTNYDTLLERTDVPGRAYQPVTKASELTTAFAPRIVKLHGSFPSQTPFIISEEDYRTYPRRFAPFVNSVQQSLLENSFVLLGFSGDDPNFLEWTGWIRDELGNDHAPIYLVGPLSLQPPARSLLARRGVTPIDLSPLFINLNPPQGVHAAALEWFLRSLAIAKVPRPEKWPSLPDKNDQPVLGCPPVWNNGDEFPSEVPLAPTPGEPLDVPQVVAIVRRWRFDRQRYPGWLILDASKRSTLWSETKFWITPLIAVSQAWSVADRLILFREINWRLEICLIPLFTEWITNFQKVLDEATSSLSAGNAFQATVLEVARDTAISDCETAWFELGFGLLREARETYDSNRWSTISGLIDKVIEHHPEHADRAAYEKVLWMMWNGQHDQAKAALATWRTTQRSPLAAMWKGGLLAELDELGDACSTLRSALFEIRRGLRNQGNNVEMLSLEGWCTYLLWNVESAKDPERYSVIGEEFWERWQELKAWNCSPWEHKEYFDNALAGPIPKPHKAKVEVHGFDPGQFFVSRRWRSDSIEEYLPAFACIRLYEQVGMPLRLRRVDIVGRTLADACLWISPFIPFWSSALIIRAGNTKEIKEGNILSRTNVAAMSPALAKRLYEWCLVIFIRQLGRLTGPVTMDSADEGLLETLPEVLSRLTVHVDEAGLRRTLPVVLDYYQRPGVRGHIRMHDSAEPWFRRLFAAADGKLLLEWLPQLIRAPLFDEGTPSVIPLSSAAPDPMRHFPPQRARGLSQQYPEVVEQIRSATDWLLRRAESETNEGRQRALFRLTDVHNIRIMTVEQSRRLGELLWRDVPNDGLPRLRNFAVFGFLHLPAPDGTDIVSAVKRHILSLSTQGILGLDPEGNATTLNVGWLTHPLFYEASLASTPLIQLRGEALGGVNWSEDETRELYERARVWWLTDKRVLEAGSQPLLSMEGDAVLTTLKYLGHFFSRAILPTMGWADDNKWLEFMKWLEEARSFGAFLTVALPYVLLHRPAESNTVIAVISADLSVDLPDAVEAAAIAVRHWIHLANVDAIPNPPDDLLRQLIDRVVFRRKAGILACLREVTFLLIDRWELFTESDAEKLESSLVPWELSTRLEPSGDESDEFPKDERPELRASLARLAGILFLRRQRMSATVAETVPIKLWRDASAASPLPEIRRAFDTWKSLEQ